MQVDYERQASVDALPEGGAGERERHGEAPWAHGANLVLGAWLLSAPATLGYQSVALVWSDVLSGALALAFAGLSLSPRNRWAPWVVSGVGLWLLFAPLVFWAPTAAAYANDTLVGTLLIAFALLIPGVPGLRELPGPEDPPGWNYNPSGWLQRAPIIALAFVGFFIARYLAAYQLGHVPAVWDPFFPDGTRAVLESEVSRAWPISDAGLGAVSYVLEALAGFLGSTRRWRTMPWLVIVFAILVVPLGVTSIVLIILQPLAVGAWCSLCLFTALAMLVMISPALDEVIATVQFLRRSHREGQPFWPVFWKGGTLRVRSEEVRPAVGRPPMAEFLSAVGLTSVPWNLLVSAALGVWLMFAPAVFQTGGGAADSDHLVGALVVTVAVIAIGEVARAARFLNVLFGAWLAVGPWFLVGAAPGSRWNDLLVGVALVFLSLPRGKVRERFGSWDRCVF
jgi:uncharacterized membrane protein